MKSIVALFTVVLVSLAIVAPAHVEAQAAAPTAEQRTRAREAYTRGQTLFDGGQFEQAQAAFEEAYAAVPNPIVLLGVASAQERRGLRAEARATLERYLRESPNARDRAQIEERIAALPAPTATTSGTATTTGTATTGTATSGTATSGTATSGTATSGTATSTGSATTSTTTTSTTSTATTTETEATETEATETEATETEATETEATETEGEAEAEESEAGAEEGSDEEPAAPTGPSATVWILTAVGAVGLVTGTVFGFMALSRQSDFDAMPTLSAADEGEAFALVADISFGIALAGGIAAIVLYATEGSGTASTDSASLRLLPSVSPQGGGLVALGRF